MVKIYVNYKLDVIHLQDHSYLIHNNSILTTLCCLLLLTFFDLLAVVVARQFWCQQRFNLK